LIQPDVLECSKCYKPIFGLYIKIEGKYFHPEHFKCFSCGVDASGANSHEYQGATGFILHMNSDRLDYTVRVNSFLSFQAIASVRNVICFSLPKSALLAGNQSSGCLPQHKDECIIQVIWQDQRKRHLNFLAILSHSFFQSISFVRLVRYRLLILISENKTFAPFS
jgi:hypothetical protein